VALTSVDDLRGRLRRRWDRGEFLGDMVPVGEGGEFPLRIAVGAPSATVIRENFESVRSWAAEYRGLGLPMEWKSRRDRVFGEVRLPAAVIFDEVDALARFLGAGAREELTAFRWVADEVLGTLPELRLWLQRSPRRALAIADAIPRLVGVTRWYREHRAPDVYLRQIPVAGVDTKFVEQHRAVLSQWWQAILECSGAGAGVGAMTGSRETSIIRDRVTTSSLSDFAAGFGFLVPPTLVRFRLLDGEQHLGGLRDISAPLSELAAAPPPKVDHVYVVENDVTALAFPAVPRAIVIFGRGYSVADLDRLTWLSEMKVVYFGDLDTHGFAILDQFRRAFPRVESILMDTATLLAYREHWAHERLPTTAALSTLTPAEQEVYDALRLNWYGKGVRLEQERIPYDRIVAKVSG
jgi:hypothetical protein